MKATFNINDDVWSEFRSFCVSKKTTATEVIRDYVVYKISEWSGESENTVEGRIKRCIQCDKEFIPCRSDSPGLFCSNACAGAYRSKQRHPNLKENFFETIDTKEKAYWLGFILADGCITRVNKHNYQFSFGLKKDDELYVDKFIHAIGANIDKKIYSKKGKVDIVLGHRKFCDALLQNGCMPQKSLTLKLPNYHNVELDLALLLGFFDGDGGVTQGPKITTASYDVANYIKETYHLPYKISIEQVEGKNTVYRLRLGWSLYEKMLHNYSDSMQRKRRPTPKASRNRLDNGV